MVVAMAIEAPIDRDANLIPLRKVLGYSVPGYIKVSRNAISFVAVKRMTAIQMNVLMSIIDALQCALIFNDCYPFQDTGEIEIPINWRAVSGHHQPKDVVKNILLMMDMKLAYQYSFQSVVTPVISNLISAALYRDGLYFVTIPGKALSWFLYCGKNVGFAKIERNVFLAISSPREKILYLVVMSHVDKETKMGTWEASVDDLRELLGYEKRDTFARINCRVIQPLIVHLKGYGSNYVLSVRQNKAMSGRKGKPAVEGVLFEIDGSHRLDECYEAALNMLSACWSVWHEHSKGRNTLYASEICRVLGDRITGFMRRCDRAGKKYKEEKEKTGKFDKQAFVCWRANTVAKILREDYGIEIYK